MQMPCEQRVCVCVCGCVCAFKAPIRGESSAQVSEADCILILTKYKCTINRGHIELFALYAVTFRERETERKRKKKCCTLVAPGVFLLCGVPLRGCSVD